ncbi:hypothetical protein OCU04_001987 [Sclerotinia nivalis]|uniref:Uncharacterized protein n=1 Tax=Sclerotinia nivalis TaxID=352851 RepID=A0A9X0B0X9_9HELO|nr:hypothetical protein OCU04_001987 [Sclerotinia nivalis]
MRPDVFSFSLDEQRFMIKEHNTKLSWEKFVNREKVEEVYLPEIEALLRQIDPSIDRIYFFDWRLRSSELATETKGRIDMNNLTSWLHPTRAVHVYQSPAAVLHRVELQLPNEAEFLLRGRVRIINAWKPLVDPVEDWPLAICDDSSVRNEDLVECDQARRRFRGATMYAHDSPDHRWYYLSEQRPQEMLLMKIFDSAAHVKATRCLHGYFRNNHCRVDCSPRRSIEVRALVFNYLSNLLNHYYFPLSTSRQQNHIKYHA